MGAPIYKMGDELGSKILDDASNDVNELNTSDAVEEDKPVISVREGKQQRQEQFNKDKKAIKDKRDNEINALGKNQENLPEGIRRKKEARTTDLDFKGKIAGFLAPMKFKIYVILKKEQKMQIKEIEVLSV